MTKRFHILSIFPNVFEPYLESSIIGKARNKDHIEVKIYDLRDYTDDKWGKVDDTPYGGGPGMVLQAEPILRAVQEIKNKTRNPKIILFSAQGKQYNHAIAQEYASNEQTDFILICGRYEGIDARIVEALPVDTISIGPFILTGGELPAMVVIDSVIRLLPGVLGNEQSDESQRESSHLVYTKPQKLEFQGEVYEVPEVLLSGNHERIKKWREKHDQHKFKKRAGDK